MEVWGFEPQTYGLQSHRSSHLSYTPPLVLEPGGPEPINAKGVLVVYLPPWRTRRHIRNLQRKEREENLPP